ncbi:alanine racemase [Actinosynnema sp. NPDC047251]|uniref:Alanine racemase n=1 Tax=Saccharothrix espanaensis (strain ATCC 51144 / DSM 44229 / JCM 9112 / NBRC 15066 / NRRL 15764) TaxID=1179773 RepID=K0K2I9_SACES|nr:alanine racemase [Saccharothrix espanaensis]CCH30773.1 Alanine racemase [Saccharothrix espanaensis DSM 44229]
MPRVVQYRTAPPDVLPAAVTAEACVDLDAIAGNVRLVAGLTDALVMAVVKADGFGHGGVRTARTALANGASWLGVTSCAEGLELRDAGLTAPVLCWLTSAGQDFRAAITAEVDISVSSVAHLRSVAQDAARLSRCAAVHLKADTGLSRNGARPEDWAELVAAARDAERRGAVRVRGIWSHLAHADRWAHPGVGEQVGLFDELVHRARAWGLDPELLHVANSAAALGHPGTHYDLVRAGAAVYGVEPVAGRAFGLRPALTLRARLIGTKRVPAGTGVSYGHRYTTPGESTLGLVPLGFADGVPRAAGDRAEVWVAGERRPVAGVISMDQFVVDLGDGPAAVGDEVVLFGPGDRGEPTVADWARWAGTNPHEVLTRIGGRVPRRHVGGDRG